MLFCMFMLLRKKNETAILQSVYIVYYDECRDDLCSTYLSPANKKWTQIWVQVLQVFQIQRAIAWLDMISIGGEAFLMDSMAKKIWATFKLQFNIAYIGRIWCVGSKDTTM